MNGGVVVALDVGGTTAKGALFSRSGRIGPVEQRSTREHQDSGTLTDTILDFARDLAESARASAGPDAVAAVGLVVPGIVDETGGVAVSSMILGWRQVPFVRLLEERIGAPTGFGHDVRTSARAEGEMGAAAGYEDYLYVSLGTGVGSCMVVGGQPHTGSHGQGGELAHFVIEPQGPPCRCGKFGCLEMVASADAVARRYAEISPRSGHPSAEEVVRRVREGDGPATGVWGRAVAALGYSIATYVELLDPGVVVVGGGMSEAGSTLFDPLKKLVARGVSFVQIAPVVAAGFGQLSGLHGAAMLAWEKADASPQGVEDVRTHPQKHIATGRSNA